MREERHEVKIDLLAQPRFNAKPPAFSPIEQRAWGKWFEKATRLQWIRPSTARHSSGILFVPKKDSPEPRVCVNYVQLNRITKPRIYAPRTDRKLRHTIAQHTWYSKIDLKDAFYCMRILENDRWKTAFRTPQGLYEWNVLPMGLKNAPGEFQLYMEEVLADFLGTNCAVHIDDVLIYAHSKSECERITRQVTSILREHDLQVNKEKSVYLVTEIQYCGYTYTKDRIYPPDRSATIADWPTPRNPTQLRQFLGITNELRDHVHRYSAMAQPLYRLTGKEDWQWTRQHDEAFRKLRTACCHTIATTPHDEMQSARLVTDASLRGIAAIVMQRGTITAIWSRALTPAEMNYPANERELLAVVEGLRHHNHLLEVSPAILVVTDNQINATNIKPNSTNRRINRWIETLMQYPLEWRWAPGEGNVADGPSRRSDYMRKRR